MFLAGCWERRQQQGAAASAVNDAFVCAVQHSAADGGAVRHSPADGGDDVRHRWTGWRHGIAPTSCTIEQVAGSRMLTRL